MHNYTGTYRQHGDKSITSRKRARPAQEIVITRQRPGVRAICCAYIIYSIRWNLVDEWIFRENRFL